MKFTPVQLNSPATTSTARKGMLSMLTIGLQGGTRFISNWLIGRVAGKLVLGLVASATALAFTLNTLWTSSVQSAASKFIARARGKGDDEQVHAVANHLAKRVLQVVLVLAAIAPFLWWWWYRGSVWEGLCISAILITVATSQFARGIHFGAGQIARGTRIDVLTSVIGIGVTALMLTLGVRDITLTLPLTIALGVYSLLCWPWTAHGRPEKALRSEMDKFVTFSALGSIASAGMLQISQLVAKGISEHAAAQYAPALQLVTPLAIIASALTMVLFPAMAEAHGREDRDALRRQTHLASTAFVAALVPIFGGMAIAARFVIRVVWGESYADAAPLMPVFCLALLAANIATPSVGSITSGPHKNMWYSLLLAQAGLLSAVVSWWLLVPRIGVMGVAVGYGIGSAVTAFSLIGVAWKLNGQRWLGLALATIGGMVAIGVLSWWRITQPVNYVIDIAVAVGFALIWSAAWSPVLLRVWRSRRGATSS